MQLGTKRQTVNGSDNVHILISCNNADGQLSSLWITLIFFTSATEAEELQFFFSFCLMWDHDMKDVKQIKAMGLNG